MGAKDARKYVESVVQNENFVNFNAEKVKQLEKEKKRMVPVEKLKMLPVVATRAAQKVRRNNLGFQAEQALLRIEMLKMLRRKREERKVAEKEQRDLIFHE